MGLRLTKGEITIKEVLLLSKAVYKGEVDNKKKREKLDVKGGKITARRGLTYDRKTKQWEQISREVRFDFRIKSIPISYKRQDTLPAHYYPVTFLLKDYEKGLDSPFRWRTGGLKKWKNGKKFDESRLLKNNKRKLRKDFSSQSAWDNYKKQYEKEKDAIVKEKQKHAKENLKILEGNIRNGLQGNFIFHLMWVLKQYGLLFGPLTCLNQKPEITNEALTPYFDKTAYHVVIRILPKILNNPKLNQVFKK